MKMIFFFYYIQRADNKAMHEEMDKRLPEPLSKNVQRFLRIEGKSKSTILTCMSLDVMIFYFILFFIVYLLKVG